MRRPLFACPCCEGNVHGRRGLLRATLGVALAGLAAPAIAASAGGARSLSVIRVQTGETFEGVYWRDGRHDREALARLDWLFRDLSRDEATPMDPRLFDAMHHIAERLDAAGPFEVISGYRAPETNAARARQSSRVSRVSLHMSGMAADLRLPGRDSIGLARLAAQMQLGGVGLYRSDGFVHLDCGPSRRW
ncbi:DUF882 domain-containing protein [Crenalkalicoccus roseus]|uniref:DUF882 domain-containing protein n=1 Tax=Crenalkalicoccus roseus TaxID=1485588 RepID=UPI0010822216|nr:DUF882 domain-containing protein [Crenalkalicoccus roseus]